MVSFTRCYKSWIAERSAVLARACAFALLVLAALACLSGHSARAQPAPAVASMEVDRDGDGIYLSASLAFALPPLVEDALEKGIPMTFIAEAELVRERWYWADRKIAHVQRYLRVSYQPLTRRWRLTMSSMPFDPSGLGVSVGQTYDQLGDVLAALQRFSRWKVANAPDLREQQDYRLQFRFQLDISQLPRPLQIGALGRSDWSLKMERSERVPALHNP